MDVDFLGGDKHHFVISGDPPSFRGDSMRDRTTLWSSTYSAHHLARVSVVRALDRSRDTMLLSVLFHGWVDILRGFGGRRELLKSLRQEYELLLLERGNVQADVSRGIQMAGFEVEAMKTERDKALSSLEIIRYELADVSRQRTRAEETRDAAVVRLQTVEEVAADLSKEFAAFASRTEEERAAFEREIADLNCTISRQAHSVKVACSVEERAAFEREIADLNCTISHQAYSLEVACEDANEHAVKNVELTAECQHLQYEAGLLSDEYVELTAECQKLQYEAGLLRDEEKGVCGRRVMLEIGAAQLETAQEEFVAQAHAERQRTLRLQEELAEMQRSLKQRELDLERKEWKLAGQNGHGQVISMSSEGVLLGNVAGAARFTQRPQCAG